MAPPPISFPEFDLDEMPTELQNLLASISQGTIPQGITPTPHAPLEALIKNADKFFELVPIEGRNTMSWGIIQNSWQPLINQHTDLPYRALMELSDEVILKEYPVHALYQMSKGPVALAAAIQLVKTVEAAFPYEVPSKTLEDFVLVQSFYPSRECQTHSTAQACLSYLKKEFGQWKNTFQKYRRPSTPSQISQSQQELNLSHLKRLPAILTSLSYLVDFSILEIDSAFIEQAEATWKALLDICKQKQRGFHSYWSHIRDSTAPLFAYVFEPSGSFGPSAPSLNQLPLPESVMNQLSWVNKVHDLFSHLPYMHTSNIGIPAHYRAAISVTQALRQGRASWDPQPRVSSHDANINLVTGFPLSHAAEAFQKGLLVKETLDWIGKNYKGVKEPKANKRLSTIPSIESPSAFPPSVSSIASSSSPISSPSSSIIPTSSTRGLIGNSEPFLRCPKFLATLIQRLKEKERELDHGVTIMKEVERRLKDAIISPGKNVIDSTSPFHSLALDTWDKVKSELKRRDFYSGFFTARRCLHRLIFTIYATIHDPNSFPSPSSLPSSSSTSSLSSTPIPRSNGRSISSSPTHFAGRSSSRPRGKSSSPRSSQ